MNFCTFGNKLISGYDFTDDEIEAAYKENARCWAQLTRKMPESKIQWIPYPDAENMPESEIGGIGGWFQNGHRWPDYLAQHSEALHPTLEALRQSIIENNIRFTGRDHQWEQVDGVPLFPDGTVALYSYRAWGDLMAAVWSTQDGCDYSYMNFYC